jgi:KUP system potassium uptake protein
MALGSIGVVFGDIGTSPLYALRTALSQLNDSALSPSQVIGVVSLIIWALLLVVTGKYVLFLMQADNKGEGGTLSLVALAQNALGRRTTIVFLLGVAGAALFSGDAIITPAISVLSALEGLKQVDADLAGYVLPATLVILVLLFAAQSRGTARVATFFSPIMVTFFVVNAVLGLAHIASAWIILEALSPIPGLWFIHSHGLIGFIVLGSVFLAVTGAEALYADMGHFGRRPIQAAWLFIVLPALVCNYLGQGALIITNPKAVENPFYLMAPAWALVPLILLATAATVIASQAVITGAFSLTSQAIQLGLLPRLEIVHTSSTQEGQIFIPRVNRIILVGVLALVLLFRTSEALGNAYGIAVSGTMVVDTSLAFFVVWKLWRWSLWAALALAGVFLVIDVGFFFANLYKVVDGGWVPLTLGTAMFILMWTWSRGSAILLARTHRDSIPMLDLIKMLEKSKPMRVQGTSVFLTNDPTSAPSSLMHNLKHNKVLHERVVLLNVRNETTPRVTAANRYEMTSLSPDFMLVTLHFGYMEQPHIPRALAAMRKAGLKFDIMTTSFFLGRRTLKTAPNSGMPLWQDKLFIAMTKQAASAPDFFNLPSDRVVELGAQMKV